jgi:tetratricopeptide (TPR) repeat protein
MDGSSVPVMATNGETSSLVPEESRIPDFDARAALAEIYSYRDSTWDAAVRELTRLLTVKPQPAAIESLAKLADLATVLGHARTARGLNETILAHPDVTPEQRIMVADRMLTWGDFYGAERIYRAYLKEYPDSRTVFLSLAHLLASAERYEESEEMYRRLLLKKPADPVLLMGLAGTKGLEKDFSSALALLDGTHSPRADVERVKADILLRARRFKEARDVYLLLDRSTPSEQETLTGIARSYCEEGAPEQARPYAEKALTLSPESVAARFFRDWDRISDERYLPEIRRTFTSPRQLAHLGTLYAEYGSPGKAVECYEAALEKDPDYFPARIALAQTLAVQRHYDRSIDLYRQLKSDFPGTSKIRIGLARVLGWSKRYEEALSLYGEIERENPADPVPKKERARTAVWAKQMNRARDYYDVLLAQPVDRALAVDLDRLAEQTGGDGIRGMAETVRRKVTEGSQFQGYEAVENAVQKGIFTEPAQRAALEKILTGHLAAYRIQKEIALEKEAKLLSWNKRFMGALDEYNELIAFKPGNEEALFDRGQVECSLGLCGDSRTSYRQLLNIDPLHSLAGEALRRTLIGTDPAVRLSQDFWEEKGRGELSQIRRYKTSLGVSLPVFDNYTLDLSGNAWVEAPIGRGPTYTAYGHTLSFQGTVNRYLSGAAGWTEKRYTGNGPGVRETGYARISYAINDYVRVDAGYDRSDEIYNDFGIQQGGIQSDSYWAGFFFKPERRISLSGKAGYLRYTDRNEGEFAVLSAGYDFSDHPRVFRTTLNGEYRNTRNRDLYVYSGQGELLTIIHPYWTPQHYYAGSVTFEWNHDLSRLFFCGGERHYYVLKTTFGTDSEDNPAARIEVEWHYEFLDHWMLSLKGLLHRSREWDAIGSWFEMKYRF